MSTQTFLDALANAALPKDQLPQDIPGPGPGNEDPFAAPPIGQALPDSVTNAANPVFTTALDKAAQVQAQDLKAQRDAQLAGTPVTTGGIPQVNATGAGIKIIAAAEKYLGTPYVWGGTGPNGVDCSGLVQMAYRAAGINLPRISYQQANAGLRMNTLKGLRPGDLIAWDNSARNNGADHIAIYMGGGRIIEAAHPGTSVRYRMLGKNEHFYGVRMSW